MPMAAATLEDGEGLAEQYRVLHHVVFEKVAFEGGTAKLIFCVRWWPSAAQCAERFELDVRCSLQASRETPEPISSLWRPSLLWDDSESVGFQWHPPALPSIDGLQEVDNERRCIASHFERRPGSQATWCVKLSWQCQSSVAVPRGLWAVLQILDGLRILCPGSCNGCFEVPLRAGVEARAREVAELRDENAQLQAQLRQAEAQRQPPLKRTFLPRGEGSRGVEARAREVAVQRRIWREEWLHRRGRIRIFGRIRGLRPDEASSAEQCAVVRLSPKEVALPAMRRIFEFDLVFGPEAQTTGIWEEVSPLVDSVFDQPGMHACVMAYGQTGAGKTFTMEGSAEQMGLITRTVEHLFKRAADERAVAAEDGDHHHRLEISVSMIEIYQEQLYDLLNPSSIDSGRLTLRNDGGDSGPEVRGLHIQSPETLEEAISLYQGGTRLRRLGTSERNTRSSRSHTVFSLYVKRRSDSTDEALPVSKISLVDLAGSERQSGASDYDRARVREACSINRSLTTLGKVVQACIARSSSRRPEGEKAHVPYRDSVLTRLLSDSIGGQAKTMLIVHVTPHARDAQESQCTLQFAANAACVQERAASSRSGEERCQRDPGAGLWKTPTPCRSRQAPMPA